MGTDIFVVKKKSIAYNLLKSEDVLSAIECIKTLGSKVKFEKNKCEIIGNGFHIKKKGKILINAGNSGTLGRIILGLLINSKNKIKLVGDKSLSKRDFSRVIEPLKKFGANFNTKKNLPLTMKGLENPKAIKYFETRGSAQCKTSIMFAALKSIGTTEIKAKKSRNHTELLFKYLGIPIRIKKGKKFDMIKLKGIKRINSLDYRIPGDISSCAFFLVLTILSDNSELLIRDVNINSSRTGIIKILKKMGAIIKFRNKKIYKGEKIADIFVKSSEEIKSINCPENLNSSAIDEFLVIFLVAARAKGVSTFKNLDELNKKESPRLDIATKILKKIGVKIKREKNNLKIYGNPNLNLSGNYIIKNFRKDHRVFMMSCIAALIFGGKWKIYDSDSINSSFPSFLKKIKFMGAKIY